MTSRTVILGAGLALVAFVGCDTDAPFDPVPIGDATVVVQAFYDHDLQPGFGGADRRAEGLRFQVVLRGSETAVAEGVTDELGVATMEKIPVGTYDLRVDPTYLADSLVVTEIDTTRITLTAGSTFGVAVGVTPVSGTVAEARALAEGRRIWVEGIALNRRGASLDQSIHVLGSDSVAIRVVLPASSPGAEGDSVRVLGRAVSSGATRHLVDGVAIVTSEALWPVAPREVAVGEVADAAGGTLDAHLVVAHDAVVADTLTIPFVGRRVTITDGEESFVALLRIQNGFETAPVPGTPVAALAGLLTPDPDAPGRWLLVPRSRSDALFGSPPPGGG